MKRILALLFAILMIFTITSCKKEEQQEETKSISKISTNTNGQLVIEYNNGETENIDLPKQDIPTPKEITEFEINEIGELILKYNDNSEINIGKVETNNAWSSVLAGTYYAKCPLKVYKEPNTNSEVIYTLNFGKAFGIMNSNQKWAEVMITAQTQGYIDISWNNKKWITTNSNEVEFTETNKAVYAIEELKLYNTPYYEVSNSLVYEEFHEKTIKKGTALIQTGTSLDGKYARIQYGDKKLYCKTEEIKEN